MMENLREGETLNLVNKKPVTEKVESLAAAAQGIKNAAKTVTKANIALAGVDLANWIYDHPEVLDNPELLVQYIQENAEALAGLPSAILDVLKEGDVERAAELFSGITGLGTVGHALDTLLHAAGVESNIEQGTKDTLAAVGETAQQSLNEQDVGGIKVSTPKTLPQLINSVLDWALNR